MPTPTPGVSISELMRAAFYASLITPTPIAGVDAANITRARQDLYSDREADALNVKGEDEQSKPLGEQIDDNELVVELDIYVRAAQGEVWETLADALWVKCHARLTAYGTWPAGFAKIRKIGMRFGGFAAELTPGLLTVRYAIRFLNMARAVDEAP
jgi:hypothetical protein